MTAVQSSRGASYQQVLTKGAAMMSSSKKIQAAISTLRSSMSDQLLKQKSVVCPCCSHISALHKRTISHSMLSALSVFVQHRDEWFHLETVLKNEEHISAVARGDAAKLRHWGFIEAQTERRGYYRVTQKALEFLLGTALAPRHVFLYRNEVIGMGLEKLSLADFIDKEYSTPSPRGERLPDGILPTFKNKLLSIFKDKLIK